MRHLITLMLSVIAGSASISAVAADSKPSDRPVGYGLDPVLPEPKTSLIPTVKIAPAKGWPEGAMPRAAPGLEVKAYARDLVHPRWLYVLPNGDVLVAESNAPERPEAQEGVKGFVMKKVMERAGAAVPSPNRITMLRDANGDGVAEMKTVFMSNLNSPFGMALIGENLFVANTDAVMRFPYREGQTQITAPGAKVADLPAGPLNHHWTKNIIASSDGSKLYATVGSNSNIAENGMDQEDRRAAILEIDVASGATKVFASGLRNPNGMDWHPQSGALWTVVNERDELGDDLVPDYLTSVKSGGFYGWPYSYFGQHVDERVEPQKPELVAQAIKPDYALGAHTASLGLTFYDAELLPQKYRGGAFIGQHGSWNRDQLIGYKVIFVPFSSGRPTGAMPEDILTGFVSSEGNAYGRPVGVIVDGKGALLVADDVGNRVWRIAPTGK